MSDQSSHNLSVIQPPAEQKTQAGNYFVSNYPPFSFWRPEHVADAEAALDRPPSPGTPLGLYVHIPFCRKRCHFCYFKVYTDRNAAQIRRYLDAVIAETRMAAARAFIGGRKPSFIYFGGGTPSYLSGQQLQYLVEGLQAHLGWDEAREVAFEAEPGTLTEKKVHAIRDLGVTRLSYGVENLDDTVLELNNRAHHVKEVLRAYDWARGAGFPQINIDLIAGMLGETESNWHACIEKTIELAPDSVTIYQMEIPFNTTIYRDMKAQGRQIAPVADWPTKRRWVADAFARLEQAGYTVTSAYTAVRDPQRTRFLYRDALWSGADMLGVGVSAFSHVNATHYQNEHNDEPYMAAVEAGRLPIYRAMAIDREEQMVRQFLLKMKLGHVENRYFLDGFGVDVTRQFSRQLGELQEAGLARVDADGIRLTRPGLLQIDRLLPAFFLPRHQHARYA